MTPREKIEKASADFIDSHLANSQEYLNSDKSVRKCLITVDLYKAEEIYENGAEYGYNFAIENIVEWLENNVNDYVFNDGENWLKVKSELFDIIKQTMKL